jgi:lipopolysaccharide/colanic/teichoic acid biosynthesis glycosyltransferase
MQRTAARNNTNKAIPSVEQDTADLLPNERFRADVEREMLRSDRTGVPLTLVLFDIHSSVRSGRERQKELARLATVISTHTRQTDSKGWYRDSEGLRVGLLLHHTRPGKAHRIIQTINGQFQVNAAKEHNGNGRRADISYEVFSYPNEDRRKIEPSGNFTGQRGLGEFPAPPRARANGNGTSSGNNGAALESLLSASMRTSSVPPLLAPPLPRWKRAIDIAASAAGLLALSPLLAGIVAAIKLTSRGPVFFKQERVGRFGEGFQCLKFRSMTHNADATEHKEYLAKLIKGGGNGADGEVMAKLDAFNPQITPVGRVLRMSCLDELPQLINVLRGEMSLVGPRPCLPYEADEYKRWHRRRFDTVPGITGLWQVMGKNKTTFQQMIRYDIIYARNLSFWMDAKILFLTFPAIMAEVRQGLEKRRNVEAKRVQHA